MNQFYILQQELSIEKHQRLLEKQLQDQHKQLSMLQNNCQHMEVILGKSHYALEPVRRCLWCGKRIHFLANYMVDASNIFKEYNLDDYEECAQKFYRIQLCAYELLQKCPTLSQEELQEQLNSYFNFIEQEEKKLAKKMP